MLLNAFQALQTSYNVYLKFLKPAKDQIEEGEKDGRTVTLCKLV